MSHWSYRGQLLIDPPEGAFGFVYRITNNDTGMMYIGRKYLGTVRRVKQKNKKRRKVIRKESNWREYCGSSDTLLQEIADNGKRYFKFEILVFGYTKGQVNFLEEVVQIKLDVLINPMYYNTSIGSRRFLSLKIDDKFKSTIESIEL